MRIRSWVFAALVLVACGEQDEDVQNSAPEPVEPVVVSTDPEPGEDDGVDVAALQARVAELEGQLGERNDVLEPTTPETANIPDGVDAPPDVEPEDSEGENEEAEEASESESSRRRRGRRYREDEEVLINPLDVLLGE